MRRQILLALIVLGLAGQAWSRVGMGAGTPTAPSGQHNHVDLFPKAKGPNVLFVGGVDECYELGYERALGNTFSLRLAGDTGPGSLKARSVDLFGYGLNGGLRAYVVGTAPAGLFLAGHFHYFKGWPAGGQDQGFTDMRFGPQVGLQLVILGRVAINVAGSMDRDAVSNDATGLGVIALPIQNTAADFRDHLEITAGWVF